MLSHRPLLEYDPSFLLISFIFMWIKRFVQRLVFCIFVSLDDSVLVCCLLISKEGGRNGGSPLFFLHGPKELLGYNLIYFKLTTLFKRRHLSFSLQEFLWDVKYVIVVPPHSFFP